MKISYLMTVYNDEQHLDRSISSILNQTYDDIELVIINDGSNDGSEVIINKYLSDDRVKFINRKKNMGRLYSLNEGLREISGELLFINDSDDYSCPERTRIVLDFFQKKYSDRIGMIFTSSLTIDEAGHKRENIFKQGFVFGKSTGKIFKYKLLMQNFIVHSSVTYVVDILKRVGGFATEVSSGIDYFTYLKIMKEYDIYGIKDITVERNIHSNNYFLANSKDEDVIIRKKWIRKNYCLGFMYNILHSCMWKISDLSKNIKINNR